MQALDLRIGTDDEIGLTEGAAPETQHRDQVQTRPVPNIGMAADPGQIKPTLQQEIQDLAVARALDEDHRSTHRGLDPIRPGIQETDPVGEHDGRQVEAQRLARRVYGIRSAAGKADAARQQTGEKGAA